MKIITDLLWILLALLGLGALGMLYQAWALRRDRARFPPPGKRVDVGGYRLHIFTQGEARPGLPTVLFDTGLGGDHSVWGYLQPLVSQLTRTAAYDRAGLGSSDPRPAGTPLTARFLADELAALLRGAEIEGPLVLVGHSFGGHTMRIFAACYPERVAGMVLVDCSHEDMWQRFNGQKGMQKGTLIFTMRLLSLLAPLGILRLVFSLLLSRLPGWSGEAKRRLFRTLSDDRHWRGVAAEAARSSEIENAVRTASPRPLGSFPLIAVAALADKGQPGSPMHQAWQEMQAEHAALSTRGELRLPPGVTHLGLGVFPQEARHTLDAIHLVVEQASAQP